MQALTYADAADWLCDDEMDLDVDLELRGQLDERAYSSLSELRLFDEVC